MKVILLKTVKGLGNEGDVVEAKDGYATNYLLPKKIAIRANEENMASLEEQLRQQEAERAAEKEAAQAAHDKLDSQTVVLKVKAGTGERLFGSVTAKEIADVINATYGLNIDKRKIDLKENIKEKGLKELQIKLHPEVTATLTVDVQAI